MRESWIRRACSLRAVVREQREHEATPDPVLSTRSTPSIHTIRKVCQSFPMGPLAQGGRMIGSDPHSVNAISTRIDAGTLERWKSGRKRDEERAGRTLERLKFSRVGCAHGARMFGTKSEIRSTEKWEKGKNGGREEGRKGKRRTQWHAAGENLLGARPRPFCRQRRFWISNSGFRICLGFRYWDFGFPVLVAAAGRVKISTIQRDPDADGDRTHGPCRVSPG